MQAADATVEWSVLQNQYDSYEKYSLVIKLANVLTVAVLLGLQLPTLAGVGSKLQQSTNNFPSRNR